MPSRTVDWAAEYTIGWHRGGYVIAFCDDGRRIRRSLGTNDRGIAEHRAGQIWAARIAPRSERLADLWPGYVRERRLAGVRTDRFDPTWKALAPHFAHRMGTAITRADCRDYYQARRAQRRANSTIRTELELLRACLRHHYGATAPALWLPPASAPRDRHLDQAEIDRLMAAIETPHVTLFVTLALTTAARMTAILELTWSRIDFEMGTIDLNPPGRHKTNKRRTIVPMNARARAALKQAHAGALSDHVIEWAGKPVTSVKKAIRSAALRSQVPCSPHVFRHTAAVRMAQADLPMAKIAQYLGHTSSRVTEAVYARYSPSYMRDAADALNW